MKQVRFRHEVVESIPEKLQTNTLYVTTDGDVAGHQCACGCGREVITPLSPSDWSVSVNQRGVSLCPSIGNWSFPCRSHYFIWDGAVEWAGDMSHKDIEQGRRKDKARKRIYYERLQECPVAQDQPHEPLTQSPPQSLPQRLLAWLKRQLVE